MRCKKIHLGLLLSSVLTMASAANIAYVPKVGPGDTAAAGTGKQWPTNRFVTDPSGNCVTDRLTGLMWTKNANLLGDGTWGAATTAGTVQYKVAQMNTNSTATGYNLCGYTDWRLPNIKELLSLVNYKEVSQANWLNNNGFNSVQTYFYWSSPSSSGSYAWNVNFSNGFSRVVGMSNSNYVWPVRGGQ